MYNWKIKNYIKNNIIDKQANNLIDYNRWLITHFNDGEKYKDYFDKLEAENNIAECLMIHNKDEWNKIRGGKYTRFDIEYKYPDNDYIKDLPLCKCGLHHIYHGTSCKICFKKELKTYSFI